MYLSHLGGGQFGKGKPERRGNLLRGERLAGLVGELERGTRETLEGGVLPKGKNEKNAYRYMHMCTIYIIFTYTCTDMYYIPCIWYITV